MNAMSENISVRATRYVEKTARLLAEKGVHILPQEEPESAEIYLISARLAVERRTAGGFLAGIKDKSLFTNAIYLRENFEIPVLILEGQVDYDQTAFNPEAVRGAQTALVLIYGISLLATADIEETAALIHILARQEQVGVPEISLVPKRKAFALPDLQRRVIEMLPGCGRVTARQLLQFFGSIQQIVAASSSELCQVPGVGEPKAAEIYQVLHADYEAVDTEKQIEDAIEAEPSLVLEQPFELLDRQHYIFTDQGERHIVDLVYFNRETNQLRLVELKRGSLNPEHEAQLQDYLDHAHHSSLLRSLLEGGAGLRGILASTAQERYLPNSSQISTHRIDESRVIEVLKRLRLQRLQPAAGSSNPR